MDPQFPNYNTQLLEDCINSLAAKLDALAMRTRNLEDELDAIKAASQATKGINTPIQPRRLAAELQTAGIDVGEAIRQYRERNTPPSLTPEDIAKAQTQALVDALQTTTPDTKGIPKPNINYDIRTPSYPDPIDDPDDVGQGPTDDPFDVAQAPANGILTKEQYLELQRRLVTPPQPKEIPLTDAQRWWQYFGKDK